MIIKVSTTLGWPLERQDPTLIGRAPGVRFVVNEPVEECDAWIVYQGLFRPETTVCFPENVILVTYEPPGLHTYREEFTRQFARVVTSHRTIRHPRVVHRHQAQPWLAGVHRNPERNHHRSAAARFDIADFEAMEPLRKDRLLSVLCTDKAVTSGHRERLRFLEILQARMGVRMDVFGYGFNPVGDKWEALERYRYHIVLENTRVDDYWTEKLADAYLGFCLPVVSGCPNLSRYFDEDAFVPIDLSRPTEAADRIQELVAADPYEARLGAILRARRSVLHDYNLFEEILRLVEPTEGQERVRIALRDERLFLPGGWMRPLIRPVVDRFRRRAGKEKPN